nr:MAG TPA: hypothetical protein [Caudoviricetes sp.]
MVDGSGCPVNAGLFCCVICTELLLSNRLLHKR